MRKRILHLATHAFAAAAGFALGVYLLPILIAPAAPSAAEVGTAATGAEYRGVFRRDLKDSDFLHWGEGVVTEADFKRLKSRMARVGEVKTFENFVVQVPAGVDVRRYAAVVVWCETFSQFITAARYK